jgi:site-specific recombinase XerD
MANIKFNLRVIREGKESPIVLRTYFNALEIKCRTEEKATKEKLAICLLSEKDFKELDNCTTTEKKEYKRLREKLDFFKVCANNTHKHFIDVLHQIPTTKQFQDKFYELAGLAVDVKETEIEKEKENLLGFIQKIITQSKSRKNLRTGKSISQNTIKVYNQCLRLLKEFSKTKRRIDFENIDLDFYHDFKEFMMKKEYSQNTIAKHFITLKSFLNEATERGINTNFAYKSKRFTAPQVETDTIYLDSNELNELFKLDLTQDSRLERVRDLFLVGCYTGLRFSDFSNISPNNIKGSLIEIRAQKTNDVVVIPIHPHLRQIMSKYVGKTANSLPPSISNQKMNKYLKELGEKIEVLNSKIIISTTKGNLEVSRTFKKFEKISTHTARRSFATNLYNEKFPTQGIMKLTGHRTEKSFLKYIRVTPTENAIALSEHWENNSNLKIG